jgi:hypothetical protein
MSNYPKLTNYVSEIDQFLLELSKKYPEPSLSQIKEKEKYLRVYFSRDNVEKPEEPKTKLWEGF